MGEKMVDTGSTEARLPTIPLHTSLCHRHIAANTKQTVWGIGIHEDVVQSSLIALLSAASNVSHRAM
jgi:hypothetical protein